jgi:hypothetical protein
MYNTIKLKTTDSQIWRISSFKGIFQQKITEVKLG